MLMVKRICINIANSHVKVLLQGKWIDIEGQSFTDSRKTFLMGQLLERISLANNVLCNSAKINKCDKIFIPVSTLNKCRLVLLSL